MPLNEETKLNISQLYNIKNSNWIIIECVFDGTVINMTQLAGVVEYTDSISAEG